MGSELKKGVILNYINLALSSLIPFLYTPIMLDLLGQEEYALYKLSGSITGYLSLISLGLGSAITRYLIKARTEDGVEEERKVLGLFVMIFRSIAIVTLVAGVVLSFGVGHWYDHSLAPDQLRTVEILIFILACNTSINFLASPYISVVNAYEKFVFLQTMSIFATCAGPILNLIALYMGFASIGLAISSLIATITFRIIYYLYVRRSMCIRPIFAKAPTALVKDILTFSFWVFVSNIVSHLYVTTDTVLMGAIPDLAIVGIAVYSVGEIMSSMVFSINGGISALLVPKANKMVFEGANNAEITDTAIRMGRIQCLIISLVIFGFIAFGQPFIHFYVGDDYKDAYWVAVVIMLPNMIPLVQSFCLNVLMARNKNKFRALVYLGIAILNVIGTWYLLHIWGIIGAALMTGLSLVIGNGVIMNWYYHHKMGLDMLRFWREVGQVVVLPLIMSTFVILLYRIIDFYNIWILIIGIVFYTIIYLSLNWKFVLNNYERALIQEPISMFFKKITNKIK